MILVDGGYLTARSRYAFRNLATPLGIPTGAVFGFVSMIKQIKNSHPDEHIVVCMDSYSKWRADLLSSYKAGRETHQEGWFESDKAKQHALDRKAILAIVPAIPGVEVVRADEAEADDLIAIYASKNPGSTILSSDKDLWQLAIFDAKLTSKLEKGKFIFSDYPSEFTGVDIKSLALYRAIMGDSSDEIPKVRGVKTKDIQTICERASTIEELLYLEGDLRGLSKSSELVYANIEQVKLNYEICKLPNREFVVENITSSKDLAISYIEELQMTSLRSVIE